MGYMGLKSYGQSDNASGTMSCVVRAMIKTLKSERRANKNASVYNTDGDVNTCLLIESGLFDFEDSKYYLADSIDFFQDVEQSMEKQIKDATGFDAEHVKAYKRMLKNLKSFIKKNEER